MQSVKLGQVKSPPYTQLWSFIPVSEERTEQTWTGTREGNPVVTVSHYRTEVAGPSGYGFSFSGDVNVWWWHVGNHVRYQKVSQIVPQGVQTEEYQTGGKYTTTIISTEYTSWDGPFTVSTTVQMSTKIPSIVNSSSSMAVTTTSVESFTYTTPAASTSTKNVLATTFLTDQLVTYTRFKTTTTPYTIINSLGRNDYTATGGQEWVLDGQQTAVRVPNTANTAVDSWTDTYYISVESGETLWYWDHGDEQTDVKSRGPGSFSFTRSGVNIGTGNVFVPPNETQGSVIQFVGLSGATLNHTSSGSASSPSVANSFSMTFYNRNGCASFYKATSTQSWYTNTYSAAWTHGEESFETTYPEGGPPGGLPNQGGMGYYMSCHTYLVTKFAVTPGYVVNTIRLFPRLDEAVNFMPPIIIDGVFLTGANATGGFCDPTTTSPDFSTWSPAVGFSQKLTSYYGGTNRNPMALVNFFRGAPMPKLVKSTTATSQKPSYLHTWSGSGQGASISGNVPLGEAPNMLKFWLAQAIGHPNAVTEAGFNEYLLTPGDGADNGYTMAFYVDVWKTAWPQFIRGKLVEQKNGQSTNENIAQYFNQTKVLNIPSSSFKQLKLLPDFAKVWSLANARSAYFNIVPAGILESGVATQNIYAAYQCMNTPLDFGPGIGLSFLNVCGSSSTSSTQPPPY